MNRIILALVTSGALLALSAESRSVEEIILLARENNPQLLAAENDLLSAGENLVGPILLGNSSLSVKGDYRLIEPAGTAKTSDRLGASLSVSVPVTDQLSLSASLDDDMNYGAGIALKPLNLTANRVNSEVKLDRAKQELDYGRRSLDWTVLNLILNLALAEKEKALYDAREALENEQYLASHALYLAGDATYDDYLSAMDALTGAEEDSLNKTEALQSASKSLWTSLGLSQSYELEAIPLDRVDNLAASLDDIAQGLAGGETLFPDVAEARNSLLQAERTLETTLRFHPDLSVTANLNGNLEESSSPNGTLSVSLGLSRDSFNGTALAILEAERNEKELALEQTLFESRLEEESLLSSLELARKALDLARRDYERSKILADETALLTQRGERTILEQEEARLSLEQSEIRLYDRASSLIKAASEYILLFPQADVDLLALFI